MEFSIAIRSIKTPTDANYITTLTFGGNVDYQKITGRVYNFKKVSEGKYENDKYGYWSATAELTNLINPFTNPITNTVVAETKIEIVFNDIHGWGASVMEKDYFQYLADSAGNLIIARYNQLYGVAIKLLISPEEAKPIEDTGPIPELSLKYISHVDAEAGVTKVTFEVYEMTGSDSNGPVLSLLGKLDDFSPFEMDQTTKKISILLSDIDKVKVVSSKIGEWLDKYQTNLPKDTKYVLQGYPVETKKEVTTETKTGENKNVDNTAINLEGEFTFDVQEDDLFKGINNQFPVLEIIGKGEIKETPIEYLESNEVVSEDDYVDEEYQEEDYEGLAELKIEIESTERLITLSKPEPLTSPILDDANIDYANAGYVGPSWKSFKILDIIEKLPDNQKPPAEFKESLKRVLYYIKNDPAMDDKRKAAYVLGTAFGEAQYSLQRWESDYLCVKPIGLKYPPSGPCQKALNYYRSDEGTKLNYYTLGLDKNNWPYFGRGLIQLTGKDNYQKFGDAIGVDLVGDGDLAIEPQNSYRVAVAYMSGSPKTFKHVLNGNLHKARGSVNAAHKEEAKITACYNTWVSLFSETA